MIITEKRVPFEMSEREFSLVKEMCDVFMLDFPDAHDVVAFDERLTEAFKKEFVQ